MLTRSGCRNDHQNRSLRDFSVFCFPFISIRGQNIRNNSENNVLQYKTAPLIMTSVLVYLIKWPLGGRWFDFWKARKQARTQIDIGLIEYFKYHWSRSFVSETRLLSSLQWIRLYHHYRVCWSFQLIAHWFFYNECRSSSTFTKQIKWNQWQ